MVEGQAAIFAVRTSQGQDVQVGVVGPRGPDDVLLLVAIPADTAILEQQAAVASHRGFLALAELHGRLAAGPSGIDRRNRLDGGLNASLLQAAHELRARLPGGFAHEQAAMGVRGADQDVVFRDARGGGDPPGRRSRHGQHGVQCVQRYHADPLLRIEDQCVGPKFPLPGATEDLLPGIQFRHVVISQPDRCRGGAHRSGRVLQGLTRSADCPIGVCQDAESAGYGGAHNSASRERAHHPSPCSTLDPYANQVCTGGHTPSMLAKRHAVFNFAVRGSSPKGGGSLG